MRVVTPLKTSDCYMCEVKWKEVKWSEGKCSEVQLREGVKAGCNGKDIQGGKVVRSEGLG